MKLITPEIIINQNYPFSKDRLNRKPFAESLTRLITKVEDNLVISLDAQWGDGKTTFVKMWQAFLEQNNIKCIYFDAFKNDFFNDPFVALVGNITSLLEKTRTKKAKINDLKKKASKVGVQLLSMGARVGIKAATLGTIQDSEINKAKDIISNTSAFASKIIEEKLNTYKGDIDAIDEFRCKLSQLAQEAFEKKQKPLVFIVDELDRCKPTYALELIEKVKHLFAVKHLVFVLVMHRQQMEEAVKCLYGPNIDSRTYLQKFINIECTFPKNEKNVYHEDQYKKYCSSLFKLHELDTIDDSPYQKESIEFLARALSLSLRDMQRCYTNLVLFNSTTTKSMYRQPFLVALIIILKVKKPSVFEALKTKSMSFDKLWSMLNLNLIFFTKIDGPTMAHKIDTLKKLLRVCLLTDEEYSKLDQEAKERQIVSNIDFDYNLDRDEILPYLCNQIESFQFPENAS